MKGNGLTRAKKARMVKNNQVINSLLTGEKPKVRNKMPEWTKPDYKPPYQDAPKLKTISSDKKQLMQYKKPIKIEANTQLQSGTGASMPMTTKKKKKGY